MQATHMVEPGADAIRDMDPPRAIRSMFGIRQVPRQRGAGAAGAKDERIGPGSGGPAAPGAPPAVAIRSIREIRVLLLTLTQPWRSMP